MTRLSLTSLAAAVCASLLAARGVAAQEIPAESGASTACVGIESVTSADVYAASDDHQGSAVIDISAAWRVASRVQASFRPVISRGLDGACTFHFALRTLHFALPLTLPFATS